VTAHLAAALADYRTGMDAELQVLAQLESIATRQHALAHPAPAEALTNLGAERERSLAALNGLEQHLEPLRAIVASQLEHARTLPGFAGVADRHRRAAEYVAAIMRLDAESLQALQRADQERRAAAQNLEAGEVTLAAYRRVLQQPLPSAGLFDERG
jgi:hypothetical protein